MPCLDRRDLNPDEWYWLLEVHQGPVWLPCEIRKRLIRLDLISESRRPTLTGVGLRVVRDGIRDAMASIRKR
jgi:hypothetical protein